MKYSIFLLLTLSCFNIFGQVSNAQVSKTVYPVVYIDNIKSDVKEMHKINPADIIDVAVFKGDAAINKIGPSGKDGLIYVQTRNFVRNNYWKFLSSKSPEYAGAVATSNEANDVQYVLNGHLITTNIEKTMGALTDKNFRSLVVINKEELNKEYKVKDKKYGIIILSDPRNSNPVN